MPVRMKTNPAPPMACLTASPTRKLKFRLVDPTSAMKYNHQATLEGFACVNCGATTTAQRRRGPAGLKTLCNSCGLRWARLGRLTKAVSYKKERNLLSLGQVCDVSGAKLATKLSHAMMPVSSLLGCSVHSPSLPAPSAPGDILWHPAVAFA